MVQQIITLQDMEKYCDELFTGEEEAKKAAPILKGILANDRTFLSFSSIQYRSPSDSCP